MRALVDLTPGGSRTVKAVGPCADRDIVDAAGYSALDLVLTVLASDGVLGLRLETALTRDAAQWQSLGVFTPLVAGAGTDRRGFRGVLRFVRWRVETLTGTGVTFSSGGTAD